MKKMFIALLSNIFDEPNHSKYVPLRNDSTYSYYFPS